MTWWIILQSLPPIFFYLSDCFRCVMKSKSIGAFTYVKLSMSGTALAVFMFIISFIPHINSQGNYIFQYTVVKIGFRELK